MGSKDPDTGKVSYSKRIGPVFPDHVLVKGHNALFGELKSEMGKVSPERQEWIDALVAAGQVAEVMRQCRDVRARHYGQGSLAVPGVPLSPPGNVDVEGHQLDA